jgi:transcriptional regulator with XRE-family HTH domain
MQTPITVVTVLDRLKRAAEAEKSNAAFAAKVGVSPQYLSDVLRGYRSPGPKLLNHLRLERREVYIARTNR